MAKSFGCDGLVPSNAAAMLVYRLVDRRARGHAPSDLDQPRVWCHPGFFDWLAVENGMTTMVIALGLVRYCTQGAKTPITRKGTLLMQHVLAHCVVSIACAAKKRSRAVASQDGITVAMLCARPARRRRTPRAHSFQLSSRSASLVPHRPQRGRGVPWRSGPQHRRCSVRKQAWRCPRWARFAHQLARRPRSARRLQAAQCP